MPLTSSTLTPLSGLLRLLIIGNCCWARIVGAYKIHLTIISKSSRDLGQLRNNILKPVKNIFICVNLDFVKSIISNVSFRTYRTEEMMLNAAATMAAARTERSFPEQQFLIPRPKENSWGHRQILAKDNIVRAFVGTTPVMKSARTWSA